MFASIKKVALVAAVVAMSGIGFSAAADVADPSSPILTQSEPMLVAAAGQGRSATCRRLAKKNKNPLHCQDLGKKI